MMPYHVAVHREDDWYIGRVLERPGVTTQGRTLDELVKMLRDAIEVMWAEKVVQLELVLTPVRAPERSRARSAGGSRHWCPIPFVRKAWGMPVAPTPSSLHRSYVPTNSA